MLTYQLNFFNCHAICSGRLVGYWAAARVGKLAVQSWSRITKLKEAAVRKQVNTICLCVDLTSHVSQFDRKYQCLWTSAIIAILYHVFALVYTSTFTTRQSTIRPIDTPAICPNTRTPFLVHSTIAHASAHSPYLEAESCRPDILAVW